MRNNDNNDILQIVGWVFLSLLFAYAAIVKIPDPAAMRSSIEAYRMVDGPWAVAGAYLIPWIELWAALGLAWRRTRAAAALILVGLMTIFTLALGWAWARGISLQCGCFGAPPAAAGPDSYPILLLRDIGLLILSIYVFYTSLPRQRC